MTDVTKDWAGGEASRETADPTEPAPSTSGLVPDTGDHTPPAATSLGEARTFGEDAGQAKGRTTRKAGQSSSGADGGMSEEESLLRASLETIRVKADELKGQARGWAEVRRAQALQTIDERPLTAVAAAFGAGLVLGALLSR